jgi:UMF1 family MFS transporter
VIGQLKARRKAEEPTRGLIAWAFHDWASSAFAALIQTFVFAAYFTRQVAENETAGTAQWGQAIGLAGLVVAIGGPVLGAIADQGGRRKPWWASFTVVAVIATALLWLVRPATEWVVPALALVALATASIEFAGVFYNAMLPSLARFDRIGRWSGWGWGLGYAGGLLCLLLALFGFVSEDPWFPLDRENAEHVRATFLLTAIWLLVFSVPLLLLTPDEPRSHKPPRVAVRDGLAQIAGTLRELRRHATVLRFLIARMLFVDGLATLFAFGGVYAAGTFDMSEGEVLAFGILLNVTAGVGAIGFAWVDDWLGPKRTIVLALLGLILAGTMALVVTSSLAFWILGGLLGIFVGPAQAASRSYLGRVAPQALRNQFFGLFALSGKATAFAGPLLVGGITVLADSQRVGMSIIVVFFALGLAVMLSVPEARKPDDGS